MQPKTKLQHRVVDLSKTLPNITDTQKTWGIVNCLDHIAYRTPNKTNCMDCGHSWASKGETELKCTCPSCNTKLTVQVTKDRVFAQREFYCTLSVVKEFQVVRLFEIRSYHKSGQAVSVSVIEICSQWIMADGTFEYIGRLRGGMGWNQDTFTGYLEIRGKSAFKRKYDIYPTKIYPKASILPVFKRNGANIKERHHLTPHEMFSNLNDPIFETLLKAKQTWVLQAYVTGRETDIKRYWNSIKVAMRNNYKLTKANVVTWLDYLRMLDTFDKDLRSAKYVCPANLEREHNRYVEKRRELNAKIRLEEQKKQMAIDNQAYQKAKKAFLGLCFSGDNIIIKVLNDVQEFFEESNVLHHCVYSSKYYDKPNSLILSARIDDKPVETIEIDLPTMKIVQSRGLQNEPSKHHKTIVKLVKGNLPLIGKTYKLTKKSNKQAA